MSIQSQLRELWPFRDYSIQTSLSPDEAADALANSVGKRVWFSRLNVPFVGTREGNHFRITRSGAHHDTYLPAIDIDIRAARHGTCVAVRMRLTRFTFAFMSLWMSVATFGATTVLIRLFLHGHVEGLIAILLPLAGAALGGGCFAFEARKADRFLRSTFATAPVPSRQP